jgi:transcriptional regulator with XRE-family HTH domain
VTIEPGTVPQFTQGDRMRLSLKASGVGVQEMAEYLGVSRYTISNWINDRIHPRLSDLRVWAMRTGVPLTWLQTGQAPGGGPDGGLPQLDSNQQPFVLQAA